MAKINIPHTKCEKGQTKSFLTGSTIFSYTHLENLAQVYRVNYLYIYNICYLHMCVGQRAGGHGHITEYAGHIIHQSTWHTDTVFGGERWKI